MSYTILTHFTSPDKVCQLKLPAVFPLNQALGLIDRENGQIGWMKTWDELPLDYCLNQLWSGAIICESDAAQKLVRIDLNGNITVGDLPNGIWDLATGEHVLGGVLDQFLVVPIGIAQGASAGVEVQFIKPDFSYRSRYQVLVPNSAAAQPLHVQTQGAVTLVGALTSAADGSNRQHTWGFSQSMNLRTGSLDTSGLGEAAQASLLEAGFFASAAVDEAASEGLIPWKLYGADGVLAAQGQSPVAAVQAVHTQLRAGNLLDLTATTAALQSGKIPAIMPNRSYFLGEPGESCAAWPGCASESWTTADAVKIQLKSPGTPLINDQNQVVFTTGSDTPALEAYGVVDAKLLWEGMVPPLEDAGITAAPQSLGSGLAQLAQLGNIEDSQAKGVMVFWQPPQ